MLVRLNSLAACLILSSCSLNPIGEDPSANELSTSAGSTVTTGSTQVDAVGYGTGQAVADADGNAILAEDSAEPDVDTTVGETSTVTASSPDAEAELPSVVSEPALPADASELESNNGSTAGGALTGSDAAAPRGEDAGAFDGADAGVTPMPTPLNPSDAGTRDAQ